MVELKLLKSLLEHMISYSQASFFSERGTWKEGFWNTTICKVQSLNLRRNSENPIYTIFWSYENKNA